MGVLRMIAQLGLDATVFHRTLKGADAAASRFGESVGGHLKSKLAGVLGIGAIEELGRRSIEWADRINDLARQYGISTDAVQEFNYAAKLNNATIEEFGGFLQKLAISRKEALGGDVEKLKYWSDFGVTIKELKTMRLEDLAKAISRVFSAGGDPQKLITSLRELGGKSAGALIPALAEGLSSMADEAHRLGIIIKRDVITHLAEIQDRLDTLIIKSKSWMATFIDATIAFVQFWKAFGKGAIKNAGQLLPWNEVTEDINPLEAGVFAAKEEMLKFKRERLGRRKKGSLTASAITDEDYTNVKEVVTLQEKLNRLVDQNNVKTVDAEQQKTLLIQKQRDLLKEIYSGKLGREDVLKNLIEVEEIQSKLIPLFNKEKQGNEIRDSLARIGGLYYGSDNALKNIAREQVGILRNIERNTDPKNKTTLSIPL